jgi:hypothetical protein
MCGVQCRTTVPVMRLMKKNMQGLTLTCLSTCPSDKVIENVVVFFDARNYFTK